MTIQEIKTLMRYGDRNTIAELTGYSTSLVLKVFDGRCPIDNASGKAIVSAAEKLVKQRIKLNTTQRTIRPYKCKKKAS